MLLARGKREHVATLAIGIDGFAANTARHLPHEFLTASKEAHMRPAKVKTDAEPLAFADNNICALFTRGLNGRQSNRFSEHSNQQRLMGVCFFSNWREVNNLAKDIRRLHNNTSRFICNHIDNRCIRADLWSYFVDLNI